MTIFIDITEFARNPIRSGIQRVVREILRGWPAQTPMRACIFDHDVGDLFELTSEALELLVESSGYSSPKVVAARVNELIVRSERVRVPHSGVRILVPEVFFEPLRCRHYMWRLRNEPDSVFVLFFDFIPWLYPDLIGVKRAGPLMHYIALAQNIRNAAFISETTMSDWRNRILRDARRAGTVFALGADGLCKSPFSFDVKKNKFVCIGSIDGRKNQDMIAQAFIEVLQDGRLDIELVFIGYVFDKASVVSRQLEQLTSSNGRVLHLTDATDGQIVDQLAEARATIYVSEVEGFGLPPVESLFAGIPVIVSKTTPSCSMIADLGQVRLGEISQETIRAAIREMCDNEFANSKWEEAARLRLQTWGDFARAISSWAVGPAIYRTQSVLPA